MTDYAYISEKQIQFLQEIGGPPLIKKMIHLFFDLVPTRIEEIETSEKKEDWEGVYKAVHALKSSIGNFGAEPLFDICKTIEQHIRDEQPASVPPLLREMKDRLEDVISNLKELQKELEA